MTERPMTEDLVEILVSLALFAVAFVVVMINAWLRDRRIARLRYTSEAANTNFKLYSSLPDTDTMEGE